MNPELIEHLINAGSGLLGTLLGGIIAYVTLRSQLRHERREGERDRKLSLRRDIYMETAAAIGRSQLFLGDFSRQDIITQELANQLRDVPGALNRAQLVASEETFEALEQFGEFFASRTIALLALRMRVDHLQNEIDSEQVNITRHNERRAYIQAKLAELGDESPLIEGGRAALLEVHSQLKVLHNRLITLTNEHVKATEELGRAALKATLDSQVELGRVNVQIRRELELPLSEGWYISRLQKRAERLQPKINDIYRHVDRLFEETEGIERSVPETTGPHANAEVPTPNQRERE